MKVGTFTVIVILVSWWGIKWLGGQNILLSNNIYTVYYDDVTGLMESSRIKMRGVEVGNVRSITLLEERVEVELYRGDCLCRSYGWHGDLHHPG